MRNVRTEDQSGKKAEDRGTGERYRTEKQREVIQKYKNRGGMVGGRGEV